MQDRTRAFSLILALLLSLVLSVAIIGCAKNPVSGRRQLMLISEEQEFAIGEGADREVRKEFGSYLESPALRSYVDRVGNSLAAKGERPGMVFHFEVLDSPVINAFALPGGFVYVTRGMLERLSSEDELAMVLGHEIGHVTARHGASKISKLYALQYGSLVGAVISPRTFVNYSDLINLALSAALSKYSREHESQADELGAAYSTTAGYQPEAGVTVMKILKWLEGKEPGALEKWFLSHPPADERIADIREQVAGLTRADAGVKGRPIARGVYLRQIDGLIVGLHNGAETVLKDRYYNKELAVAMQVPQSFEVNLDPNGALVSMNREEKEYLILESSPMHTSVEAADVEKEFDGTLRRRGWTRTGGRQERTGQEVVVHLATYTGKTSKNEPIGILKAFLVRGKRTWTVTGLSELAAFEKRREAYERVALDLTFLSEEEAASLRPPRLVIDEAPPGATWDSLAAEHLADPNGGERLAFYNGLDPALPPAEGTLLKLPPSLAPHP